MPELPEVETVRRGLERLLKDQPVVDDLAFARRDLRDPIPTRQIRRMIGQPVHAVHRRGKYLLFETPVGFLISHLGMTGSWRAADLSDVRPHDHFTLSFAGGLRLVFRDPRRFGILDWAQDPAVHPRLKDLGPEPFVDDFGLERLRSMAKGRIVPVKNFLMTPVVVVGVGNIYASEALFRAGVKPSRPVNRVKDGEWERIIAAVREVLFESIEAGGSSISDYVNAEGADGMFQTTFRVYDRESQTCVVCTTRIKRTVLGGRSTFHCSKCQR